MPLPLPLINSKKKQPIPAAHSFSTSGHSPHAPVRHMKRFTYRCFLPDLTRFTGLHCARRKRCGPTWKRMLRKNNGGESGIRTPDTVFAVYTLSRRAPSTTRTTLRLSQNTFTLYLFYRFLSRVFSKSDKTIYFCIVFSCVFIRFCPNFVS